MRTGTMTDRNTSTKCRPWMNSVNRSKLLVTVLLICGSGAKLASGYGVPIHTCNQEVNPGSRHQVESIAQSTLKVYDLDYATTSIWGDVNSKGDVDKDDKSDVTKRQSINPHTEVQGAMTMAKSPDEIAATMIANLKDKTGKTMQQWLKITRASRLGKHGEIVKLLKSEHGVTHGFANLIAHETLKAIAGGATVTGDELVDQQYAGPKADLLPIYKSLIAGIRKFGKDIEIAPKKAYVSIRRNKQFAIIQPSTKTRVDVGINLKGTKPTDRLEASGSFNTMVSHRVRVEDKKQIDKELLTWLKDAYTAS